MADFTFEVTRWVDRAREHANEVLRTIAMDAVNRVKELTPVDTGFLRSNWTAIRKGEEEPVAGRVPDPARFMLTARVGDVIVIVNPTVYARVVEYGFVGVDSLGRHHNRQGVHMMAQTMAELPAIADRALSRLGRGG
jgi:hypothetical protein